jgi:heptosyltransferase-2
VGWLKSIERSGKRALMRGIGGFLRARPIGVEEFESMRFDRILVIRQHNQMGDMMLAIPALRAVRETYPNASIGVVSSTLNAGVLVNSPYLDRVFTYDKRRPWSEAGMVARIRAERYHLAIVLHTVSFSFTSLALAVLSGARVRIGSTSRAIGEALTGSYLNLTLPLPDDATLAGLNEAEHNLFPLRWVGITTEDIAPLLVPGADSEQWADAVALQCWREGTLRLAVHPGAGKVANIWPPERFAAVVDDLNARRTVSLAIVQGPRDAEAVLAFQRACGVAGTVVRGRSITDVAALMQRADLVLCNDTGVMHVAAAARARVVAVFGPTDPFRWAPRCDNLRIVRAPGGNLQTLGPPAVVDAALEWLGASNAGSA